MEALKRLYEKIDNIIKVNWDDIHVRIALMAFQKEIGKELELCDSIGEDIYEAKNKRILDEMNNSEKI